MLNLRAALILTIALVAVLWLATPTSAGQTSFQRLEEVAGRIQTVLRVKVVEASSSQDKMKLKDGSDGPMLRAHYDFQCQVNEVVYGKWDLEKGKTVRLRHTLSSGAKYDEDGKLQVVLSYSLPHSGLETELKTGDEFLACLQSPAAETEQQFLFRAEKAGQQAEVLAAIKQAKAWELFKQKHADLAKSVLLAGFDSKSGRLALLIDTESRPIYLVNPADGTILSAKTHLVAPMNQIYFDEKNVVLRANDEAPRPVRWTEFR